MPLTSMISDMNITTLWGGRYRLMKNALNESKPLDYFPPRDDFERREKDRALGIGAALVTALAVWFLAFIWVVTNMNLVGTPSSPAIVGPLAFTLVIAAAIATPAIL